MDGRTWCQPRVWSKSRVTKRCTGREAVGKTTHQPTVTKNYKNTQSKFDSTLGSCDVSVAPRSVRLSSSSGTQLLLLPKSNNEVLVPLLFYFLNYPPYVCKPSKNCKALHGRLKSQRDGTEGKLTVDSPFPFRRERGTGKI